MSLPRLTVITNDPLIHDGVCTFLRVSGRVELLEGETAIADIALLLTWEVTDGVLAQMETLADADPMGRLRLVLVANRISQTQLIGALERGLVSVLPRPQSTLDDVLQAVLSAHTSRADIPARLLRVLSGGSQRSQHEPGVSAPPPSPTYQEIDVLRLVADGLTTSEAAEHLQLTERTVKNTLRRFSSRYGLRNRPQAVAYAIRAGLV